MKIFWKFLRKHAVKIIIFFKQKVKLLTKKNSRNHMKMPKCVIIVKKIKVVLNKKYFEV